LELNGTHQFLVYADYFNVLGENVNTIKKNTETLLKASREVGLEVKYKESEVYGSVSPPECRAKSQLTGC
jgi:hypothetical protein